MERKEMKLRVGGILNPKYEVVTRIYDHMTLKDLVDEINLLDGRKILQINLKWETDGYNRRFRAIGEESMCGFRGKYYSIDSAVQSCKFVDDINTAEHVAVDWFYIREIGGYGIELVAKIHPLMSKDTGWAERYYEGIMDEAISRKPSDRILTRMYFKELFQESEYPVIHPIKYYCKKLEMKRMDFQEKARQAAKMKAEQKKKASDYGLMTATSASAKFD